MSRYDKLSTRDVQGMFYQEYATPVESWVSDIANEFKSDQPSESYPFIGANSGMSEVMGGSLENGHNVFDNITVTNRHYDNVLVIPEVEMRRDKTGQIQVRIGELVDDARGFNAEKVSELIKDGESSLSYDGLYFYDTTHQTGDSGSQSNIVTVDISELPALVHGATAANPSPEEIQQAVGKCIAQMVGFKNDKGKQENRNVTSFTVMLPFGLWNTMFSGVVMPNASGVSAQPVMNMGQFKIKYELNFELSAWTDQFVVFRTDSRTKSFIVQDETEVRMQLYQTPTPENGYCYKWSVDVWKGFGYGRWERSVLCKLI